MAQSAIAQPLDPDLPTSSLSLSFLPQAKGSSFSMNAVEGGEEDRGRSGHPYVPKNLPVLILAEKLYGLVAQQVSSSSKKKDAGGVRSNYGGGVGQDVGWRGDQRPSGRNQPPPQSSPYQYPSAEGQPPAQTYGYATNEGSRRPQGGFGDKTMDSLISAAARRSKRDWVRLVTDRKKLVVVIIVSYLISLISFAFANEIYFLIVIRSALTWYLKFYF